jgi:hypothetical protein
MDEVMEEPTASLVERPFGLQTKETPDFFLTGENQRANYLA